MIIVLGAGKKEMDCLVVNDIQSLLTAPRGDLFIFPFGRVNSKVLGCLDRTLRKFYASLNYQVELKIEKLQPLDKKYRTGELYDAQYFLTVLDFLRVSNKITLGVTEVGVFEGEKDHPRFGVGASGKGIISTFRFVKNDTRTVKLQERVGKEAIKVLSFSYGLSHCQKEQCLLSYHPTVDSLDKSIQLCKDCTEAFSDAIREFTGI